MIKPDQKRFSDKFVVRCPPRLSPMIDRAAERRCMVPSEYIRQSIVERLISDGFEFGEMESA
jgi:predicted HicB family RNase H-like nuclease